MAGAAGVAVVDTWISHSGKTAQHFSNLAMADLFGSIALLILCFLSRRVQLDDRSVITLLLSLSEWPYSRQSGAEESDSADPEELDKLTHLLEDLEGGRPKPRFSMNRHSPIGHR